MKFSLLLLALWINSYFFFSVHYLLSSEITRFTHASIKLEHTGKIIQHTPTKCFGLQTDILNQFVYLHQLHPYTPGIFLSDVQSQPDGMLKKVFKLSRNI